MSGAARAGEQDGGEKGMRIECESADPLVSCESISSGMNFVSVWHLKDSAAVQRLAKPAVGVAQRGGLPVGRPCSKDQGRHQHVRRHPGHPSASSTTSRAAHGARGGFQTNTAEAALFCVRRAAAPAYNN
jgi:hypothetical protein